MLVSRLDEHGREFQPFGHYASADDFLVRLRGGEWFEPWGKAHEISQPTTYPEFYTVDVVFRSSRGKSRQRFLIPTVGPDA